MTLRQKQSLFASLVPGLILKALELGFEVTLGEALRFKKQARANARRGTGIKDSLHILKLALDLNLFRDGKYLRSTEAHRELGEWWEEQHELCCWGGRFGDGNHYSVTHAGRK